MNTFPSGVNSMLDKIDDWFHKKLSFIVLPGFNGMPLYDVLSFFFRGLFKGVITYRAAAIAFNFDFNFSWWCSHDFELLIHFCLHFFVLRDCFLPVLLLILFAFKFLFN